MIDSLNNQSIKWIHFIGHGGRDVYGRDLGLVLADAKGDVERIDDKRLINALRTRKGQLELITFNACCTGKLVSSTISRTKWGKAIMGMVNKMP